MPGVGGPAEAPPLSSLPLSLVSCAASELKKKKCLIPAQIFGGLFKKHAVTLGNAAQPVDM